MNRRPRFRVSARAGMLLLSGAALAVGLSRWMTRARLYYNWDSVQYALGTQQYDLRLHQPHPPGSAFYVFLARLLNELTGDPHQSLLLISAAASGLTVLALYSLGAEVGGRRAGAWAALLGACSPLCWFYGSVGLNYAADGLFAALVALHCLRLWRGRRDMSTALLAGVCLAAAGGFRPTTVVFLAPLWLVGIARAGRRAPLAALVSAAAAGAVTAAWLLPTAAASGGPWPWLRLTRDMNHVLEATAIWHSPDPGGALAYAATTHRRCLEALFGVAWLFLAGAGVMELAGRRPASGSPPSPQPGTKPIGRDEGGLPPGAMLIPFFALWIAPAALFYLLAHFNSPGYCLVYAPAMLVLAGSLLARWTVDWSAPAQAALAAALAAGNGAVFWWGVPWAAPQRYGQRAISRAEIADHDAYWTALRRYVDTRYAGRPVLVLCSPTSTEGLRVGEALLPDRAGDVYQVVGELPKGQPPSIRALAFLHFCTAPQLRSLAQPVLGVWRTADDRGYHQNTLAGTFGQPATVPIGGRYRALLIPQPERPGAAQGR